MENQFIAEGMFLLTKLLFEQTCYNNDFGHDYNAIATAHRNEELWNIKNYFFPKEVEDYFVAREKKTC